MPLKGVFVVLFAGCLVSSAHGQSANIAKTGLELYLLCASSDASDQAKCDASLAAFIFKTSAGDERKYCLPLPGNTHPDSDRLVVLKFLRDNSRRLDEPAYDLFIEALSAAFPCKGT